MVKKNCYYVKSKGFYSRVRDLKEKLKYTKK